MFLVAILHPTPICKLFNSLLQSNTSKTTSNIPVWNKSKNEQDSQSIIHNGHHITVKTYKDLTKDTTIILYKNIIKNLSKSQSSTPEMRWQWNAIYHCPPFHTIPFCWKWWCNLSSKQPQIYPTYLHSPNYPRKLDKTWKNCDFKFVLYTFSSRIDQDGGQKHSKLYAWQYIQHSVSIDLWACKGCTIQMKACQPFTRYTPIMFSIPFNRAHILFLTTQLQELLSYAC